MCLSNNRSSKTNYLPVFFFAFETGNPRRHPQRYTHLDHQLKEIYIVYIMFSLIKTRTSYVTANAMGAFLVEILSQTRGIILSIMYTPL